MAKSSSGLQESSEPEHSSTVALQTFAEAFVKFAGCAQVDLDLLPMCYEGRSIFLSFKNCILLACCGSHVALCMWPNEWIKVLEIFFSIAQSSEMKV